jgi:hypothetical protein
MKFLPAFFRSTASETISTISAAYLISEILSSGIKPANNSNLRCYETGETNISGRVLESTLCQLNMPKLKYPKSHVFSENIPGKWEKCQDQIPAEFNR